MRQMRAKNQVANTGMALRAVKFSLASRARMTKASASGEAGSPEHLYQALSTGKASAALAASIFHYGQYSIPETKQYLADRGVPVRLSGFQESRAAG